MTDFPGEARDLAVGFSIGNKGYFGTGVGNTMQKDFWEFDQSNNQWTKKADFGGGVRAGAVGFVIGQKGYIGTGYGSSVTSKNDFWVYDPAKDTWTQKANFGGVPRYEGSGFSINGKGYIGIGYSSGFYSDFWEYDPENDSWSKKANFGGISRMQAVAFTSGNKGYVGTGYNHVSFPQPTNSTNDFWEYNPANDSWTQLANFDGGKRFSATGFSIGTYGYIGTGDSTNWLKDFWEYSTAASNSDELEDNSTPEISVFPNPAKGKINFGIQKLTGNINNSVGVSDLSGRNLFFTSIKLSPNGMFSGSIDLSSCPPGIYYISYFTGTKTIARKLLLIN